MARNDMTHIAIDDIMTRGELAEMLGVRPQYVNVMLLRGTDNIPEPFLTTSQGMLFSRAEMTRWAKKVGRVE